jgi:hypothetical protein
MAHMTLAPDAPLVPRTIRWCIAAGYVTPFALVGIALVAMPRDMGDLGGSAALALTMMAGVALGGVLLLASSAAGIILMVRDGRRARWSDFGFIAAGVAPLIAIAIDLLLHV